MDEKELRAINQKTHCFLSLLQLANHRQVASEVVTTKKERDMFNILKKQTATPQSANYIHSICYGLIFALVLYSATPAKTVEVKVPVTQVVMVPQYINEHDRAQINCMAENVYFEAGNQGQRGMVAVSNVVMNRVADKRFPKTACGVIKQRWNGSCQFSWVCNNPSIRDRNLYERSKKVAEQVYLGNERDITSGALFYHATYISPGWRRTKVAVIGDHIFYR
jgi:spore germination cell wall hydrolase CwlJ-like protein